MQLSSILFLTITGLSSVYAIPMAEIVTQTTVEYVTVSSNYSSIPTIAPTFSGYNSTVSSTFAGYNTTGYINAIEWYDPHDPATDQIISKVPQTTDEELNCVNHDKIAFVVNEQGKTFDDAKDDVLRGLQVAKFLTSITTELQGLLLEVATYMESSMIREPFGVIAAICPVNFPTVIPLWTNSLVIATGNTSVLKPSERDPVLQ